MNSFTCLIIEDSYYLTCEIQEYLKKYRNDIEIYIAESLTDTYKILSQKTIDLIITNTQVSDGNPIEDFKKKEINTPLIIYSTYHLKGKKELTHLIIIDYLILPITQKKLENSLKKYELTIQTSFNNSICL